MFYGDLCNNIKNFTEEISSPIFSIDDEDIQLGDFISIYKPSYRSYGSGCSQCIKKYIIQMIMFLMSNIILQKLLIFSSEFSGFNPEIAITETIKKKGIWYSKNYLKGNLFGLHWL